MFFLSCIFDYNIYLMIKYDEEQAEKMTDR